MTVADTVDAGGSEGSPARAVTYHRLVDGGLVYDDRQGCIHHLNETAALIWEAWREGEEEAVIARRLCERYEVDPDTARREVDAAVQRFQGGASP